jgi:hypothetical protein
VTFAREHPRQARQDLPAEAIADDQIAALAWPSDAGLEMFRTPEGYLVKQWHRRANLGGLLQRSLAVPHCREYRRGRGPDFQGGPR